jgi:hypothetical protein
VAADHGGRVESRPSFGISAEQPGDGLRLVSGIREEITATSTNALNISGCITARSTAHVPPIDQPVMPQLPA